LLLQIAEITQTSENIIREKDNQFKEAANTLQTENMQLREIIDDMRNKAIESDTIIEERNKQLEEAYKDVDMLKQEYTTLNITFKAISNESNKVKSTFQGLEEAKKAVDHENNDLRNTIAKLEDEIRVCKANLDGLLKEKMELINKTEYISAQVKKVLCSVKLIDRLLKMNRKLLLN
jgi:chromosome segregation ATPase